MDIDRIHQAGPSGRHHDDHDDDVLEELNHLEAKFYNQGYSEGHAHGALHGLFEGRELGKEKAFEIWEEVGFYEGWARGWVDLLQLQLGGGGKTARSKEARAFTHANHLLNLISTFPTTNPDPGPSPSSIRTADISDPAPSAHTPGALPAGGTIDTQPQPNPNSEVDLSALMQNIRARYRLLCSALGTRPRLIASKNGMGTDPNADTNDDVEQEGIDPAGRARGGAAGQVIEGIEGPMKGVDTTKLRF